MEVPVLTRLLFDTMREMYTMDYSDSDAFREWNWLRRELQSPFLISQKAVYIMKEALLNDIMKRASFQNGRDLALECSDEEHREWMENKTRLENSRLLHSYVSEALPIDLA